MELQDALKQRRSIKKYLNVRVEEDKIGMMIEAAVLAPSAGNLQSWGFVVVKDAKKREEIASCCLEQFWMAEAPVHIVVCAELKSLEKFYGNKGVSCYARENCAAAIQNMLLKATELGLGTCWVGAFNERTVKKCIGLEGNPDVMPVAVITVGYTEEKPVMPQRKAFDRILFFENWGSAPKDLQFWMGHYGEHFQNKVDAVKEKVKSTFKRS